MSSFLAIWQEFQREVLQKFYFIWVELRSGIISRNAFSKLLKPLLPIRIFLVKFISQEWLHPFQLSFQVFLNFSFSLVLFLLAWLYFLFQKTPGVSPNITIFLFPFYIILMSGLGFSFGILISSLTTRYRDLRFLIQFGIQLLMFATPIVYPLEIASEKYRWLLLSNPITGIVEAFATAFIGQGSFSYTQLIYSFLFMSMSLFFKYYYF